MIAIINFFTYFYVVFTTTTNFYHTTNFIKIMKKIVFALTSICALMLASCINGGITEPGTDKWDGTSTSEPASGSFIYDDTEYPVFFIDKASELAWFAQQVNSQAPEVQGMSLYFNTDVDLDNKEWTPIGYVDYTSTAGNPNIGENVFIENTLFTGSVFGNGHVVENVNLKNAVGPARGFIAQVIGMPANPSVIKDINLRNVAVNGDGKWAGGLVGYVRNVKEISGCSVENVTIMTGASGMTSDAFGCGGLIGFISSTDEITVSDCSSRNIDFAHNGWNNGGFIGKLWNNKRVTIENCQPSQGSCRTFLQLGATIDGINYYLANDGYNNSWFIGNITNLDGLELVINNVSDNSANWAEFDSYGGRGNITNLEMDAAFAWPYITIFDRYDVTTTATITVNGTQIYPSGVNAAGN